MRSVRVTTRETGAVRGTARRLHFSVAIISVTVELRIWAFWVRSVYFNVRNTLPKYGTFPPGHSVYSASKQAVYGNFLHYRFSPSSFMCQTSFLSERPSNPKVSFGFYVQLYTRSAFFWDVKHLRAPGILLELTDPLRWYR